MIAIAALPHEVVREALRVLGEPHVPATRAAAARRLREVFATTGMVRELLGRAPDGARDAFVRLAHDGPVGVEGLLDRGWWGHGALPSPLDWAQRRALIAVADDGLVHAVAEARAGLFEQTLDLSPNQATAAGETPGEEAQEVLRVEAARAVLVAPSPALLDRALSVPGTGLRAVAPTVAWSQRSAATVEAALRRAGLGLATDALVAADPAAPALPGVAEEAVGPKGVRALLQRALDEQRQVRLQYYASSRGGVATERVVDPWDFADDLLRGWCHLRTDERTFAVDRVGRATLLPSAVDHPAPAL